MVIYNYDCIFYNWRNNIFDFRRFWMNLELLKKIKKNKEIIILLTIVFIIAFIVIMFYNINIP